MIFLDAHPLIIIDISLNGALYTLNNLNERLTLINMHFEKVLMVFFQCNPIETTTLPLNCSTYHVNDTLNDLKTIDDKLINNKLLEENINRFDSTNKALFIANEKYVKLSALFHRKRLAHFNSSIFPFQWHDIEDKVYVENIFASTGFDRQSFQICSMYDVDNILKTNEILDKGKGTVWYMDSKTGTNAGGSGIKYIKSLNDAHTTIKEWSHLCDFIKIATFFVGTVIDMYCIVTNEFVYSFPSEEVVCMRIDESSTIAYCGNHNLWEPTSSSDNVLANANEVVGAFLKSKFQYRGFFNLNGILTLDNAFIPTEINSRPPLNPRGRKIWRSWFTMLDAYVRSGCETKIVPSVKHVCEYISSLSKEQKECIVWFDLAKWGFRDARMLSWSKHSINLKLCAETGQFLLCNTGDEIFVNIFLDIDKNIIADFNIKLFSGLMGKSISLLWDWIRLNVLDAKAKRLLRSDE